MRILAVENYEGTTLGLVGAALEEAGARVDLRRMWAGDALPPDAGGHDGLVVLGGAQDALADATHPYLPALADLTRAFGEADRSVLGICLGAQIVARGHGARNLLGRPVEFGWRPVRPTAAARDDPVLRQIGDGAPVFHWHSDTFTLPPGAVHLAVSDQTDHQAFRLGRAVYGIQFHFEADRRLVRHWVTHYGGTIGAELPDWRERHRREESLHGEVADAVGLALARAWVSTVRT
jgi:GMP synthase (glutamine-hydrolysing)